MLLRACFRTWTSFQVVIPCRRTQKVWLRAWQIAERDLQHVAAVLPRLSCNLVFSALQHKHTMGLNRNCTVARAHSHTNGGCLVPTHTAAHSHDVR